MPSITTWLIPSRVLFTYQYGVHTTEDLSKNLDSMVPFLREADAPVHYIVDGTDVTKNEFSMRDLKGIFGSVPRDHKMGWICAISPGTMQRFFSGLIFQFSGTQGRSFSTVDEALRFLAQNDDLISYDALSQAYSKIHHTVREAKTSRP